MNDMTPVSMKPWADTQACPFRPLYMRGGWYVFEEAYPARGYARRQVHMTAWQIDRGELAALEFRTDWLADQFPDASTDNFDIMAVAAWIRHHANAADNKGRRPPEPAASQATIRIADANRAGPQHITTVTALRLDDGRRKLSIVGTVPSLGGAEERAFAGALTPEAAHRLAEVLIGRRLRP